MMNRQAFGTGVLAWLACASVASGAAQDRAAKDAARPGWMPRRINIGGTQLTAADRAAAIAKLEAIERVMLRVPELAHPDGFYVEPQFGGGGQATDLGAGAPPL